MPEYIEREALKAAVRKRLNNSLIISWLISIINAIPTANVAPVVYGHYVTDEWGDSSCSVCGENYLNVTQKYCPNCGARLDGE